MDYSENVAIDLHIHSTASDGTLTPTEILTLAQQLGLKAIAITDHDTVEGSKEALSLKIIPDQNFLTGVEISTSFPAPFSCNGSLHLLGYGIDVDNLPLNKALLKLKQARKNRNPGIIKCLKSLGMDISLNELSDKFQDTQVGRPHIARLMIEKGFVKSIDEAFDNFLGTGKPAYVDKYRISCEEAATTIIDAGGIPVLAHPGLIKFKSDETLEDLIVILKKMGLKGIEAYYPEHSSEYASMCKNFANRFDLLVTGGTDFHGSIKPDIQMGSGSGDFSVPFELYEKIVGLKRQIRH